MPTISELFVSLKLSAESFNNGLKEAQREAKEFEKNLKPTLTVTKDLGIAMAAAGAAIVGSFAAMSKSAVDYGDKLNDARQRTGATVETLAKLGFAAEQSGSSFEGLSTGIKFLSRNMEAAIDKSGDQRKAFNELGISSKQLADAHGDVNKVFLLLADRFKELPDGAEKSALAMRVFGKAGTDLIPLLNEGSEGIQALGKNAVVVSQEFASASDQLNDTIHEAEAGFMKVSVSVAQALLPALQSAASTVASLANEFAGFAKEHPELIKATAALGVALLAVGSALTAVAVIIPKVQLGFQLLTTALAGPAGVVVAVGAAVVAIAGIVYAYKQWSDAAANLEKQLKEQVSSQNKAIDSLKKYGIQVNLAGKNEDQQAQAVAKAGKELQAKLLATNKATEAAKPHVRVVLDEAAAEKAHERALKDSSDAQDLAAKGLKIMLDTRIQDADLLPRITRLQFEFNDALKSGANAAVQAAADLGSFTDTVAEAIAGMQQAQYNAEEMQKDFDSISKTNPGVQIGVGFETSAEAIKKNTDEARRLKDATEDIKNSAGKIFDDMFIKGESVFSSLGNALKGGVLSLGRAIFEDVVGALLGPIKKAFDDFFEGLLEGIGFKNFLKGIGDKIGGALNSVFGGGSGAAGAAGSAGSAGGGAGDVAGSETSILSGVISGAISAIGSIISSMRLEGTMNAVEANTRFTYIELRDTMDLILQPMLARLEDIKAELYNHKYIPDAIGFYGDHTIEAINRVDGSIGGVIAAIGNAAGIISASISTGHLALPAAKVSSAHNIAPAVSTTDYSPSTVSPFGYNFPSLAGGTPYVNRGGLAMLHKGESVVPAGQTGGMVIHVHGSVFGSLTEFARQVNRYVESGGGRLIASATAR